MLNASHRIEAIVRHIYRDVAQACAELGIDYLVVGAAARDLVLHHVYGAPITRATSDVDFALNVRDWNSFHRIQDVLVLRGYRRSKVLHRMFSPNDTRVDIVPFGQVASAGSSIEWPPDGGTKMSVLGFEEAYDHSDLIRLQEDPEIVARVATPVGMALLKIIAWSDRTPDLRTKDAKDLFWLLTNYSKIPAVLDDLYADTGMCERYDWDVDLMSANLLGQHAARIARPQTAHAILTLADHAADVDVFAWEMSGGVDDLVERAGAMLAAFLTGFRDASEAR